MTVYEFGCIYEDCVSSCAEGVDILQLISKEYNMFPYRVEQLYEEYVNSDLRKDIPDYYKGL